jgi:broad specificity phosphatase PhoE
MDAVNWPDIYFIRHGETAWNAERRYQGRKDIPLNPTGQLQADANGLILRRVLADDGVDPAALEWHASPLQRTRDTMERVRAAFDRTLPPVSYDVRLVEISFGTLEGLLHSELPPNMATAAGEREASYWEYRPEAGENYRDVEARLLAFGHVLTRPAVIVSHGGIARTLRVLIEGAAVADAINWSPPQDRVIRFRRGEMRLFEA